MRFRLPVLAALVAALALPGIAQGTQTKVDVGIADETGAMFADPNYQALKLQHTRYVIAWDAIGDPQSLQTADGFIAAARAAGTDVLLHFSTDDYDSGTRGGGGTLPSVAQYRQKVGALVSRYWGQGVREFGVWNEANDTTEPTYRSPSRLAGYFKALWGILDSPRRCGPSVTGRCSVVALDVLDGAGRSNQAGASAYIRGFYRALSGPWVNRAKLIGIHNYSDTNRHTSTGTRNIITSIRRLQPRARFWLTETGGVVKLGTTGPFQCNPADPASVTAAEQRAANAISWMFTLTLANKALVDRLYVYEWTGTSCTTDFDAGLTRADGSLRPGYSVFVQKMGASRVLAP